MTAQEKNGLDSFVSAYAPEFAYALDNRLVEEWYPHRLLRMAKGESLLELGIGTGGTSTFFSKHFKRHVVIEGSPEIVRNFRCQHADAKTQIVEGYFENFETDERFDVIAMAFVLEHVDDPGVILKRFRRFLKPGGSVIVGVPNAHALNKRIGFECGMIDDFHKLNAGDLELGHQRIFSLQTLRELIAETGYREVAMEGLFLKPFSTKQLVSLNLPDQVWQALMKVGISYPELCVNVLVQLEDAL